MDIYERIKGLCKKEGTSVKAMLKSNGIIYSSYYSSQQAKRLPGLSDLMAISKHFNVSLDYLITGQDKYDLPQDLRLLMAELSALDEKQRSFLISTMEYQISLFKKMGGDAPEF